MTTRALSRMAMCGVLVVAGACARGSNPLHRASPAESASGTTGTFTVLHTNDVHGDLTEFVVDTGSATARSP